MACGNSVEVNISSNVTLFVGQQQVELVSSIMRSTSLVTNSASTLNTTDVAVVSPTATVPYQAILSGNKITMFVLSSSKEAKQLSSYSTKTTSSISKLQPMLRLCIDHPLCTVTANNDDVQYNISGYDAHVDLVVDGKNYSSELCVVN